MLGIKTMNIIVPALLATVGAYAVPFQKRGMDKVVTQCKHNFAYTFDDGPYKWNTDLVNKFDSVKAKTTFFVNGNNWDCIYSDANVKALRYAYKQGHQIASHTWSHANLTTLNFTRIDEEIERLDEAFVKILGVKPKLFRPPYGEINDTSASYIQSKYGKTIVTWDLDSGDTFKGANEQGSVNFYNKLAAEGPNSKHVPLSHEVWEYAVKAAKEHTVDTLHKAGIKLITVADCLDTAPYEHVGDPGQRDDTWTCDGTWTPPTTPPPTTPPPTTPPPTTPNPACKETYTSVAGDDCTKIEAKFNLAPGTLKTANPSVTCSDIWTGTPLCIPNDPAATSPAPQCKQTYVSAPSDTCASIENKFNLVEGTIKGANAFLTCTDIWSGTSICIPDGPYKNTKNGGSEPSCVTQSYQSVAGDTCASIDAAFALQTSVSVANPFVSCTDIWANTNLTICVPTLAASDPQTCTKNVTTGTVTSCTTVGTANGVSAPWIKAWNPWVNCTDIWQGTNLCVAH